MGLMLCQQARTEDLNKRISARNVPSQTLQSLFSPRPVPTRYIRMPAIDCKKKADVLIKTQPTYSPYNVFYPGSVAAPWSGWATAIDQDSRLKNIYFPLQKCPQSKYIPSSNSELYKYKFLSTNQKTGHELLFKTEQFKSSNMDKKFEKFNKNHVIGKDVFNNNTRVQVRNLTV